MVRLFTAGLATETNSFSPIPTGRDSFAGCYLARGGVEEPAPLFAAPLVEFRRLARARGWQVAEGLCTFAEPAGLTTRVAYESLRDELLADLRAALPVDAVLLSLHGGMIADGYDDCEGDLLGRVRALVGPEVPIGAELDPHCHLSPAMLAHATALICFKHYPHVDFVERAHELFAIIADAVEGKVRPHMASFDCQMIGGYHTTIEPMRGYVERLAEREREPGVLSISVAQGFPWGDVPEAGTRLLVVTDDRPARGQALAAELGRELIALRGQTFRRSYRLDEALARLPTCPPGPVVFGDIADNTGAGAPGDATFILAELLRRGLDSVALACLYDPGAVALARAAGPGARLELRLGGKLGPMSGPPLDLRVEVRAVTEALYQGWGASANPLGAAAALHVAGVDIVVVSLRGQVFSPDVFQRMGIDPGARRLLVVKSSQHYRAAFTPIAAEILDIATPGMLDPDFAALPLTRITRPKWPLDPWLFDAADSPTRPR